MKDATGSARTAAHDCEALYARRAALEKETNRCLMLIKEHQKVLDLLEWSEKRGMHGAQLWPVLLITSIMDLRIWFMERGWWPGFPTPLRHPATKNDC